ncbi:M56 family metallopeptidase [Flavobacterium aquicola]|uniref:BlaR1 peptidase M56 n=1 Tax=Flavobacterium aquicola TaxID=1682742 RepID=A0A3E0ED63_9FLAO|nr:M56 family metallopeptidase [Flavobacterium aquicola]REG96154.1 BlaR1 peptidase M56 [Flavobacterium aquicola]
METLFIYIAKSSGLIALFFLAYYFLLRKETFFTANRWFLLAGLLTSVILPWIVFTTIVWVEPTPTDFDWSKIPIRPVQEESFEINWYLIAAIAYIIGIILFFAQFALDFYNLKRILKGKTAHQQADHKFIDLNENIAPFSYFNTIVYNSSMYSETEMESILEHEKIHSEQYHTIDVLITRFFCILFWFNPFIWLYKKAILQNLEFIADSEASKNISDKKAYQLTLLKITTHENYVALTNHFYQSLIKKRIVMLNKNQSNKRNSLKYALVIPALVAFVFFFQVKVIAQEKTNTKVESEVKSETTNLTSFKMERDLANVSKGKEIYIDGEKSSEGDLAKLNSNDIIKMDIIKNSNNPMMLVTTKNTNQHTKTVKIIDNDIYIDGVKSTKADMDKLDPKEIATMNVNKNNDKQEIRIITKKFPKIGDDNTTVKTTQTANDPTSKNDLIKKSIIIVNGTVLPANVSLDDINPAKIESMTVYNSTQAVLKYGNVGGNDVIEIVTKKIIPETNQNSTWKVGYGSNGSKTIIERTIDDKKIDYKKAVIIIDGKLSDYQTFEKINPNNIESIMQSDIKNASEENKKIAVDKYGKKALNGIIDVKYKNN